MMANPLRVERSISASGSIAISTVAAAINDDTQRTGEPFKVKVRRRHFSFVEDLIGYNDELVDTRTQHGYQTRNGRKVHLEPDQGDEPEKDDNFRGIDEHHREDDAGFAVPVVDDKTDRDERKDTGKECHRLVAFTERCGHSARTRYADIDRQCSGTEVDLKVGCFLCTRYFPDPVDA